MPYAQAGDISLHYDEAGQGGVPVLLLHELGGSGESWAAALPRFAATRRALAVDLRAAGRSEKPPQAFSIEDCANDIARLLDTLGLPRADVIGGALGSLVGAVLAIRHPARVRKLMMCAVSDDLGGVTAEYLAARAARVVTEGMRAVADASLKNAFPDAFAAERAAYRPIYLANHPAAYAALSLALTRLRVDWGAIRAPALVASGAHDFIWPPAHGQHVAGLIDGARFAVLPTAAHFPHLQTPAELVALATAFLD
jgi:3-oxoadipate enol-lactonase